MGGGGREFFFSTEGSTKRDQSIWVLLGVPFFLGVQKKNTFEINQTKKKMPTSTRCLLLLAYLSGCAAFPDGMSCFGASKFHARVCEKATTLPYSLFDHDGNAVSTCRELALSLERCDDKGYTLTPWNAKPTRRRLSSCPRLCPVQDGGGAAAADDDDDDDDNTMMIIIIVVSSVVGLILVVAAAMALWKYIPSLAERDKAPAPQRPPTSRTRVQPSATQMEVVKSANMSPRNSPRMTTRQIEQAYANRRR